MKKKTQKRSSSKDRKDADGGKSKFLMKRVVILSFLVSEEEREKTRKFWGKAKYL